MRHLCVAAVAACLVVGAVVGEALSNGQNAGDGIQIAVAPSTIALGSPVEALTVHTNVPLSAVVPGTVALNGVAPIGVWADDRGHLVARFELDDLDGIAPPEVTLTLTGDLKDGTSFAASDTVRVVRCPEK